VPRLWLFDLLTPGVAGEMQPPPSPFNTGSELMKAQRKDARRQLEQFLSTLFLPDELIELRFIESWVSQGKKRSRVVRDAVWLRREEFISRHREFIELAERERANVYFGVCPRPTSGDAQDERILTVRCLWCDVDSVSVEDAYRRWKDAGIPPVSIVVSSGSGVHGYWLLNRDFRSRDERALIGTMLPHFYRSFGGDHVQNLSRVMRPPGTVNCKDAQNGRPARPCTLYACQPNVRHSLKAFSRWITLARREQRRPPLCPVSAGSATLVLPEAALALQAKVMDIVRNLDNPSPDRSRRDFAIVCDLLRLGLTREEIWPLVASGSKFESNGRPYFDITIANAERKILLDSPAAG